MSEIPIFFKSQLNTGFNVNDPVFSYPSAYPFPVAITTRSTPVGEMSQFATVKVDWRETPEAHIFKVDAPGLKKEQVKIVAQEGKILMISGELIGYIKEENSHIWHLMERSSGKFLRCFKLPENAKMDRIKATMEDGLLTVTVPKMEDRVIIISDDIQADQNGVQRGKSTQDKGKGVVEVAKGVKGIKISCESSRRQEKENRVTKISDDSQVSRKVMLRAKGEKGKLVVREAKGLKGAKISGETSGSHEKENRVTKISDLAQVDEDEALTGNSTADKGKAVAQDAMGVVVPETIPDEQECHRRDQAFWQKTQTGLTYQSFRHL